MNLTTCSSPCRYQQDGFCTLPPGAPLGARVDGCCYFSPTIVQSKDHRSI